MPPAEFDRGITSDPTGADRTPMIWPVAALAGVLLGFVVVYGSVLQARVEASLAGRVSDDAGVESSIS